MCIFMKGVHVYGEGWVVCMCMKGVGCVHVYERSGLCACV